MDNLLNYFLKQDPLLSFQDWYADARKEEQNAEAMTFTTIDIKFNRPDSRTVLFKGMKEGNFTFYTNYLSQKAREIEDNNEVCLLFYWHVTKRQVRVHGKVRKMDSHDSEIYFKNRDRESQLASYISEQSSPIEDKAALLKKMEEADKKFRGSEIPRPENWGGFLIDPYEFEFFVYGDFRINDRFLYKKSHNDWIITRLQP